MSSDTGTEREQDDRPAFEPVLTSTDAQVYRRDEHPISRRDISPNAMKVLYRLIAAGHQAFLVGGGVRDLLLGGHPKDFDVATDATPEQVDDLFRNCRLVGRRFRLAHIRFGREIIEVATFRSSSGDDLATVEQTDLPSRRRSQASTEPAAAQSEAGMLLRDNVYGTVDDDAARRDFTINALYYTPADFCLYDFAGGMEDLEARRIRLIGDPEQRYREDPVRMLRALRFAAKLDFDIDPDTAEPIGELAELLLDVPPARLFDEIGKLFLHGHAERTFELMRDHGVFRMLFPQADGAMERDPTAEMLARIALANTDARVREDRPVTPGFLLAALLWPPMIEEQRRLQLDGLSLADAMESAAGDVLARQQMHTAVPRRFTTFIRETWSLQHRLEAPTVRRVARLLDHPRFRAAYDFLVVREQAGEGTGGTGAWWTRYQDADEDRRESMRSALAPGRRDDGDAADSSERRPQRRSRGRRGGRRRSSA
ncbi:MAG: polynucleotide adenylyltransferase PcnB [Pseudomonadales bacterium]|nr:polynucleotide adenylyltransferase PcnB [Pseudomonadales bacterium]